MIRLGSALARTGSTATSVLSRRFASLVMQSIPKFDPPTRGLRFRSWPITEVTALEPMLKGMGLRVPASEIDGTWAHKNKATGCLSDALVSVGPAGSGGTGSFISADGLIITNHHVALDAVRQASTTVSDYLKDGFVAKCRGEELMGKDYEVWITKTCVDVSEQLVE